MQRAGGWKQENGGAPGESSDPQRWTGVLKSRAGRPRQSRAGCSPRRLDQGQAGGHVPPQGAAPERAQTQTTSCPGAEPGANWQTKREGAGVEQPTGEQVIIILIKMATQALINTCTFEFIFSRILILCL